MEKFDNNLAEVFDVELNDLPVKKEETAVVLSNTIEDDFNVARQNINTLLNKGNVAIDNLLHVAKETEHPRAYEVAATFIKTMADLNKDLLEIQKKKKDINGEKAGNKTVIDKAVFVGSTTDLVKLIRSNK